MPWQPIKMLKKVITAEGMPTLTDGLMNASKEKLRISLNIQIRFQLKENPPLNLYQQ